MLKIWDDHFFFKGRMVKKEMNYRWTVFFLTLATLISYSCHPADSSPMKRPLSFQQITPKEGLSSDMVYAIAVQNGGVWFGTYSGGATHYDKSNKVFKAYTTKGEPTDKVDYGKSINWQNLLSYNHVSVIVPDIDRIWFGTYFYGYGGGGISYYHPQKNPPWKRFNTNDGRAT